MVAVLAVQKWRLYFLGQKLTVLSDIRASKYLLEQHAVQPEYQRWLTKLLGYDFEILYQLGLQNRLDDVLSRMHQLIEIKVLAVPSFMDVKLIQKEVKNNDLQIRENCFEKE